MLKAKNPLTGLIDMKNYGLWNIVFEIPKDSNLTDEKIIENIQDISFHTLEMYLKSIE